tara:strand:- start:2306 stop:2824 length:519 start_codon:yes stop_codon:yes gene_type:complete
MRILLTEKRFVVPKDFQKLLNNALRMYGESKEKPVFVTHDIIIYQEVTKMPKKEQCSIDYHCYLFLDTEKPSYQDLDSVKEAYDYLHGLTNLYRSWMQPEPFLNNLRTDYDSSDLVSMIFLSFSYSDTFSQEAFDSKESYIYESMESKMLSYVMKTKMAIEEFVNHKYHKKY